jgi:hypothetical protein
MDTPIWLTTSGPLLVAPPIRRPSPPALFPPAAVEDRLAQLAVDLVVSAAEPEPKVASALDPGLIPRNVRLEVLGAHPARVQP